MYDADKNPDKHAKIRVRVFAWWQDCNFVSLI